MTVTLHLGDCLDVMATLEPNSIDTIITDPPYGLEFMGKEWDHGIPGAAFWRAALRVAKPGAMLLAFGGTRTFHRLTCAIEDAGWEVRDCLSWLYGSGFPKSHDISKGIDKAAGAEREVVGYRKNLVRTANRVDSAAFNGISEGGMFRPDREVFADTAPATPLAAAWHGWGTALKPAWEPIILAMKPLDGTFAQNAQRWGVAGLNIDGGRIGTEATSTRVSGGKGFGANFRDDNWSPPKQGYSTINAGRWPANLLLDEEAATLLDEQSGASRFFYVAKASRREREAGLEGEYSFFRRDNGRSAQFSQTMNDGIGAREHNPEQPAAWVRNHHPTVKPVRLMEYLARLTMTPTGGVVLDPFMGSGSTGIACVLTGRDFIGIEQDADYLDIARRRIDYYAKPGLFAEDDDADQ